MSMTILIIIRLKTFRIRNWKHVITIRIACTSINTSNEVVKVISRTRRIDFLPKKREAKYEGTLGTLKHGSRNVNGKYGTRKMTSNIKRLETFYKESTST